MIRVLHVVGSMNKGGIETLLMNLYKKINRKIVQFDFAVHSSHEGDFDNEIRSLGGKIYRVTPRSKSIKENKRDWDLIFKESPEIQIIHQHVSSLTYITPLKMAFLNNVNVRVIHSHSTKAESFSHHLLHLFNSKFIHKYANHYLTCSNKSSQWLYGNNSKIQLEDITLLKNGIDASKFTYNKSIADKVRKNLNIENDWVIGHVGRFTEVKNHRFSLEIFKEILNQIKNIKLILVGHGSLEKEIKKWIIDLKIEENVIIIDGKSAEINKVYQAFDIFLLPSKVEGLGMALIEAQAAGVKSFASKDVPEEVNITNLVEFISLDYSAKYWAERIISQLDYKKSNTFELIKKNGYDIHTGAVELQRMYLNLLKSEDD